MFDAKNERTIGRKNTMGANHNSGLGTKMDADTSFEQKVSGSVTGLLTSVFGETMADGIERYMNEMGASIYNICQDSETVSEELRALFGTAADIIVDSMLKEAFAAQGIESSESYTRFDLVHGLRKLRELANA